MMFKGELSIDFLLVPCIGLIQKPYEVHYRPKVGLMQKKRFNAFF